MITGGEALETLQRNLEKGGDHHHGEHKDADWFKPAPAHGVFVLVLTGYQPRSHPNDGGAEEVEGRIDQGSEDGERAGEDDDDDLSTQEDEVRSEVDVDGHGDHGALTILPVVLGQLYLILGGGIAVSIG